MSQLWWQSDWSVSDSKTPSWGLCESVLISWLIPAVGYSPVNRYSVHYCTLCSLIKYFCGLLSCLAIFSKSSSSNTLCGTCGSDPVQMTQLQHSEEIQIRERKGCKCPWKQAVSVIWHSRVGQTWISEQLGEKVPQHYAGFVCDKPPLVWSPVKLLGRQWVSECSAPSGAALSTDSCVTPPVHMVLQPLSQLQSSYTEPGDKTEIIELCKSK